MNTDLKTIALIGPVYPYKGGIAHYTGALYKALSKKYKVLMLSYSLQYPSFLYRKEQKNFENDKFKIEKTEYCINTLNPLTWYRAANRIKQEECQMVIIQWWHPYFAPCYIGLEYLLKRVKTLFICHNVFPHERFTLDRQLTKWTLKRGNSFIVQSQKDLKDLKSIVSCPQAVLAVHPTYDMFRFKDMDRQESLKQLGLSGAKKILLFFGFVREYKGLKYLVQAMPGIVKRYPEIILLIVGDFSGNKETYVKLIKEEGVEESIKICDGYIPDEEVEKYFVASDVVVLPYESATQSGIVQMAFGFEVPVIVTNVGGLPEVVTDGKTGYVIEPRDPIALAQTIIKFFEKNKEVEFREEIKREKERFSWDRMIEHIEKLYQGD